MDEKILSVIIPMYNSGKTIQKCLDSLLVPQERMAGMEVLVVDDGSTDQGIEHVRTYSRKYPDCFRILQKTNGGHGSAVQAGIGQCKGRYFKVLDADDFVHTPALTALLKLLADIDAEVVACGFDIVHIRSGKTTQIRPSGCSGQTIMLDMQQLIQEWAQYRQLFCLHGLVYRTDFYTSLPYRLPEKVSYDDAFFFTVPCSHADRLCICTIQLYVYRVGEQSQSVSAKSRELRICQHEAVIRAILDTKDSSIPRTVAGREYWYRKLTSTTADYFVTAFLRVHDKKEGRKMGQSLMAELRRQDGELYRRLRMRYWLVRGMGMFHMDEPGFERLMRIKSRICGYFGTDRNPGKRKQQG